jgi:hypothetical protein
MTLTASTVVMRLPGLLSAVVDDEIVIFNPDRDNYVGLDDIGRALWDLLAEPHSVAELCAELGGRFDGAPAVIESDVFGFLGELTTEGIVRVVEE